MPDAPSAADRLLDRLAIQECINRNAMATDLLDAEGWKATYWPDAEEDHGWFQGNAHQFVDETVVSLAHDMDICWHLLGNTTMELDGASARVVTYFYSYIRRIGEDGARTDSFCGGRYVDRFEKRGDAWRIKHRITKPDWVRPEPNSLTWGVEVLPGFIPNLGNRAPDDPGRFLFERPDAAR